MEAPSRMHLHDESLGGPPDDGGVLGTKWLGRGRGGPFGPVGFEAVRHEGKGTGRGATGRQASFDGL